MGLRHEVESYIEGLYGCGSCKSWYGAGIAVIGREVSSMIVL
jgi:hypothetical protein